MLTLKLRIIFIIIISPQSMEDYKKKVHLTSDLNGIFLSQSYFSSSF